MGGGGTPWGAIIQSAAGGINNLAANRGASNARDMQLAGSNRALGAQEDWMKQLQGMYSPYMKGGSNAFQSLQNIASDPNYWKGYGGFNSGAASGAMKAEPPVQAAQMPTGQGSDVAAPQLAGIPSGNTGGSLTRIGGISGSNGGINPNGMYTGGQFGEAPDVRSGFGGGASVAGGMDKIQGKLPSDRLGDAIPPPAVPDKVGPTAPSDGWGGPNPVATPQGQTAMPDWMAGIDFGRMSEGRKPVGIGQVSVNDPGMEYAKQQALEAAQQRMTAQGLGGSGAAVKAAAGLAANLGNQYYGQAFDRARQTADVANQGIGMENQMNMSLRGLGAQSQNQMFNQGLANRQFDLQSQGQNFNQGMANKQFDWQQTTGNREYDQALKNQQIALQQYLAQMGYGATQNMGQLGTGMTTGMGNIYMDQANAQAAAEMGKWNNFIQGNTNAANAWSGMFGSSGMGWDYGKGGK